MRKISQTRWVCEYGYRAILFDVEGVPITDKAWLCGRGRIIGDPFG